MKQLYIGTGDFWSRAAQDVLTGIQAYHQEKGDIDFDLQEVLYGSTIEEIAAMCQATEKGMPGFLRLQKPEGLEAAGIIGTLMRCLHEQQQGGRQ